MRRLLVIALAGCSGPHKSADMTTGSWPPRAPDGIAISEAESAEDMLPAMRSFDTGGADKSSESIPLDKDQIRRVVRRHADQIRSCGRKPGIVRVSFTIDPEGKVREATARGIDSSIEDCLETTFRQFVFPAPPGNVQVTYPFAFDAAG